MDEFALKAALRAGAFYVSNGPKIVDVAVKGDTISTILEGPTRQRWQWCTFTTLNSGLGCDIILGLAEDHDGQIWFATAEGVCCFAPNPSSAISQTKTSTFDIALQFAKSLLDFGKIDSGISQSHVAFGFTIKGPAEMGSRAYRYTGLVE